MRIRLIKKIALIMSIGILAAGCNLFGSGNISGIAKTEDGGGSWQLSNQIKNSKNTLDSTVIDRLEFDPTTSQTIFAGSSNNGLLKTDDSGQTWIQILSRITVRDFFIEPGDDQTIIVAGSYNGNGKIIKTTDGGGSWQEIYNEASPGSSINAITIDPSIPNVLYALSSSGQLIKSTDGGINWFVVYDFKVAGTELKFNPLNSQLYALFLGTGLLTSADGGKTWNSLTKQLSGQSFVSNTTYTGTQIRARAVGNYKDLALDPQSSSVMYLATGSGVYKTTDNGTTWNFLNVPLKTTSQSAIAVVSSNAGATAYVSFANTIFKTLDGGQSWQTQELPTGTSAAVILIDPKLPQIVYAGLN